MPQYKKVFDAGLYSSGGGFTRVGVPTLRTPGSGGKQVAKSLRFRSANSAYLNRTFGTPTNNKKFTFSFWYKRGSKIGTATSDYVLTTSNAGANTAGYVYITADTLEYWDYNNATQGNILVCSILRKDPSAWMHIVLSVDYANATASNRAIFYVDGIAQKYLLTSYPLTTETPYINTSGVVHYISANGGYLDGYLADVNFIDGQAYDPTSFGEYNSDNIWVPKAYSGSYGTNGFYLDFADTSSTAALGYDAAGSNDWTVNGISLTSGTTYDSMYDSPTDYDNSVYGAGTYPVWNPLTAASGTFSNGSLRFVGPGAWRRANGTIAVSSGKWYYEITITGSPYSPRGSTTSYTAFGFGLASVALSTTGAAAATDVVEYSDNGYYKNFSGAWTDSGFGVSSGDVFGVAVDLDANTYTFYQNNTSRVTGTIGVTAGTPLVPVVLSYDNTYTTTDVNFGQRTFAYTPPTGFKALNTKNITRPTDANMWFYGDTPDLVWIKNRSATANHSLTDTVRGVGLALSSNSTAVEQGAQDIAELNKFGMTVIGASSRTTASANNFVYWAWKGGGAATTNTSGSITSTVSANVSAGFSVVTYTANGTTGTVGHGLGVTPSMIIVKSRSSAQRWTVFHTSTSNAYIYLNETFAADTGNAQLRFGNNTSVVQPTSSVFTIGNSTDVNSTSGSGTYVAYCFAPVAGYSAFGSYTGNASDDGPFVYLGFRPRFLMIKQSTASGTNWLMIDTSRNTYNVTTAGLGANSDLNEATFTTTAWLDVLSNGFKIKVGSASGAYTNVNISGNTYIYAAFAEYPFKIARAR